MRVTYDKTTNVAYVELSPEEMTKYKVNASTKIENLRQINNSNNMELQIPCSLKFYEMTQRQKGGEQAWGPFELRGAVRALVANRLVPKYRSLNESDYRNFKRDWDDCFYSLIRDTRLKFPSKQHPREKLGRVEYQQREAWRAIHVVN